MKKYPQRSRKTIFREESLLTNPIKFIGQKRTSLKFSISMHVSVCLLMWCTYAQSQEGAIEYKVIEGTFNQICEDYKNDLRDAALSSSDGALNHDSHFMGFEIISTIPFESMPGAFLTGDTVSGLKADINNDNEPEQLYRNEHMSMHGIINENFSYSFQEYLTIYFSDYPKIEESEEIPVSLLPYWRGGWNNLNTWEDFVDPIKILNLEPPKVTADFPKGIDFPTIPFNAETVTYVYNRNSKFYFSTNLYSAIRQIAEKGANYHVIRSFLSEYDKERIIRVRCIIEI